MRVEELDVDDAVVKWRQPDVDATGGICGLYHIARNRDRHRADVRDVDTG
jgi:hypothetical protein